MTVIPSPISFIAVVITVAVILVPLLLPTLAALVLALMVIPIGATAVVLLVPLVA